MPDTPAPVVGVFDSGVGGLSVLRALLTDMPQARFVYFSDNAHAPYGERSADEVRGRSLRIADWLRDTQGIRALVVACNTATAHAVDTLRQHHPDLPIVGVEPALKPAAERTRSGHIAVMATRGTLSSARYVQLRQRQLRAAPLGLHIHEQACDGLADAIERHDAAAVERLGRQHLGALGLGPGLPPSPIDTLVLGCTHYVFATDVLVPLCGPGVEVMETGKPVATRTRELLGLAPCPTGQPPDVRWLTTGDARALQEAVARWIGPADRVTQVVC